MRVGLEMTENLLLCDRGANFRFQPLPRHVSSAKAERDGKRKDDAGEDDSEGDQQRQASDMQLLKRDDDG